MSTCLGLCNKLLQNLNKQLLPPANEVCEGYVFTRECPLGGGGGIPACLASGIPVYLAGLQGWGWFPIMPCRSPGPHPGGSIRSLSGGVSRPTPRGEVVGSGQGGLQAHTWEGSISQHALRQTPPQLTATAAGGTHPTGMHSC